MVSGPQRDTTPVDFFPLESHDVKVVLSKIEKQMIVSVNVESRRRHRRTDSEGPGITAVTFQAVSEGRKKFHGKTSITC